MTLCQRVRSCEQAGFIATLVASAILIGSSFAAGKILLLGDFSPSNRKPEKKVLSGRALPNDIGSIASPERADSRAGLRRLKGRDHDHPLSNCPA